MGKTRKYFYDVLKIAIGCGVLGVGFNLFLIPNNLNAGGLSGLAMILVRVLGGGSVGIFTAIMNLPLFAVAITKLSKRFFLGSLIGMIFSTIFLDAFSAIPAPETEPLIGALYGGVICGAGLGLVFTTGVSTGGSDIVVRLLKLRYQDIPIGYITICFDAFVVALTGIVFRNIEVALYSGVAIFLTGRVIDAVVYRFDYSRVALIITREYDRIGQGIVSELDRGVTFLYGEGAYSHNQTKVVLTAVKKQQLAELKRLVVEIDPNAFVIVQEAHQVLGDGFSRNSMDTL